MANRKIYKVEFLKPVPGSAYFPGEKGTLSATTDEYAALQKRGFVKPLPKKTVRKKSEGA